MAGFIKGFNRDHTTLFPDRLVDWIEEDHLVPVVDQFVDLDCAALWVGQGTDGPRATITAQNSITRICGSQRARSVALGVARC